MHTESIMHTYRQSDEANNYLFTNLILIPAIYLAFSHSRVRIQLSCLCAFEFLQSLSTSNVSNWVD